MASGRRKFGDVGERVVCAYLERHGFRILDRNYLRKWGELDIVARRGGVVHFIEVKSASTLSRIRAEENMHPGKLKRLLRTIETYLLDKKLDDSWQLDLAIVKIDAVNRSATVEILENVN